MSDFPDDNPGLVVTITPFSLLQSIGMMSFASSASITWPTASRALFVPFRISSIMKVLNLFAMNGATAAGTTDIGIYGADGLLLTSNGGTAQAGTNTMQTFTFGALTLVPGMYFMALTNNNATSTFFRIGPTIIHKRAWGCFEMAAAEPLPGLAVFATCTMNIVPLFGVTMRSLV